jgi:hypothetical protein
LSFFERAGNKFLLSPLISSARALRKIKKSNKSIVTMCHSTLFSLYLKKDAAKVAGSRQKGKKRRNEWLFSTRT